VGTLPQKGTGLLFERRGLEDAKQLKSLLNSEPLTVRGKGQDAATFDLDLALFGDA
jgi:hypothetical protein